MVNVKTAPLFQEFCSLLLIEIEISGEATCHCLNVGTGLVEGKWETIQQTGECLRLLTVRYGGCVECCLKRDYPGATKQQQRSHVWSHVLNLDMCSEGLYGM